MTDTYAICVAGREHCCCCYLCQNQDLRQFRCLQTLCLTVLPTHAAKPPGWPGRKHGGTCPTSRQGHVLSSHRSHFPSSQPSSIRLSRLAAFKVRCFLLLPVQGHGQRACKEPRVGAGKKKPTVWGGGMEEAERWGAFLGFGWVFLFWRSCSVILFYFLPLQAAGRMTWLPGKLPGRCTGLLPAPRHQERRPSARLPATAGLAVPTAAPRQPMADGGRTSSKTKSLLPRRRD